MAALYLLRWDIWALRMSALRSFTEDRRASSRSRIVSFVDDENDEGAVLCGFVKRVIRRFLAMKEGWQELL